MEGCVSRAIVEFKNKKCVPVLSCDMFGENLGLSSDFVTGRTGMGIYFLWLRGELLYLGQAINVLSRVSQHCQSLEFDLSTFLQVESFADLDFVESYLIWFLRPQFNRQFHLLGNVGYHRQDSVSDWAFEKVVEILRSLDKKHVRKTFRLAFCRDQNSRFGSTKQCDRRQRNDRIIKMLAESSYGGARGI